MVDRTAVGGPDASTRDLLRTVALTGLAIVLPVLISLYVLSVAAGFLGKFLTPVATVFVSGQEVGLVEQALAVLLIAGVVMLVGFVAHFRAGKRALDYFDAAIARLPGLGTIYRSFRRMSDVMIESDADHFRDVKLVAFPTEGSYALAFETAETHGAIETAAGGSEMRTLFVPMAPNPFMGGFVLHVVDERVVDVDITVAEGIRATVTSGVALEADGSEDEFAGPMWELSDFEHVPDLERLRALGVDVDELRSLDADDLRSLEIEDVEERLLNARDRLEDDDRSESTADDGEGD